MDFARIDKICDDLLREGAPADIVAAMRANMRAERAFEEGGATPAKAMGMVYAAHEAQQMRKTSAALQRFNARRDEMTARAGVVRARLIGARRDG